MESREATPFFPRTTQRLRTNKAAKQQIISTSNTFQNANGYIMPLRTQRGKRKVYLTKDQGRAARRVSDLTRIYRDQFPNGLPHNELGVKYCRYMCCTLAFLPNERRIDWLDRHAPWLDAEIRESILSAGPIWYSPRWLGGHLEIDNEDRDRLEAWTIEAWNISKEQREVINREKNKLSHERRRRKAGAKSRAQSLERMQPWKALGMSRPTFYRLPKDTRDAMVTELARETETSRPLLNSRKDETVSSGETISSTETLPPAPSKPSADNGIQGKVTSLADYLAEKKALALATRDHRGISNVIPFPVTNTPRHRDIAQRWRAQYCKGNIWRPCGNGTGTVASKQVYAELLALGTDPKPEDIERIIGNDTWTRNTVPATAAEPLRIAA